MKFSYSLQFNTVPEWTSDYLSYGELKKAIHDAETAKLEESKGISDSAEETAGVSTGVSIAMDPRSVQLEKEFLTLFQADAQRVASAFNAKKQACASKFQDFLDSVSSSDGGSSSDVSVNKIEVWTGDEDSLEKRRASLEETFNSVYLTLHDLHDFLDLNYTGYVRVVKNYGRYLHVSAESRRALLSKIDSILPIAELSELQNKMGQVEDIYARIMCDGSITQARASLHLLLRDRVASLRQNVMVQSPSSVEPIMKSANVLPVYANAAVQKAPVKAKYFTNYRIASLIGCSLLFALILLAPKGTFGSEIVGNKQRCLAILLGCTALWITEAIPLYITALLIPALIIVLQVIEESKLSEKAPRTAVGQSSFVFSVIFGDMIFLLLGGFSIAAAFQKYGITRTAAVFILKRFGKTPSSTLLTVMIITVISSAFVSNVAAPVLCFGLIQPILKGLDANSSLAKALILGIAFGANIGGLASPIASPQSVFGADKLKDFFSFFSWIVLAMPICVVATAFCWFWLLRMYPSREILNFKEIFATKSGDKASSQGKVIYILAVFAITIVLWVSASKIEHMTGPMGIIAVFPLVALFGAGLLGKDDFNGFSWNVVILAVGGSALGKGLDYSGLLKAIGNIIATKLDGFSPFVITVIFSAILLFITTFVSHSVGAFVFLPVIIEFGQKSSSFSENAQVASLALAACFTCSAGMAMPISGFPNMTAASLQDRNGKSYVSTADFAKGGVLPSIVFAASIVASICVLSSFVVSNTAIFKPQ
jgi:phosphate transporter